MLRTGGAILLGEALQDGHNQLETLNLGFNEIGPDGGLSIATAMQNKPHISSIILNGNMVDLVIFIYFLFVIRLTFLLVCSSEPNVATLLLRC